MWYIEQPNSVQEVEHMRNTFFKYDKNLHNIQTLMVIFFFFDKKEISFSATYSFV